LRCPKDPFEDIEKSLLSACLRYERSLHAKFLASKSYGLGCGMIRTFNLYIEIGKEKMPKAWKAISVMVPIHNRGNKKHAASTEP
jgi:hypothetical protein